VDKLIARIQAKRTAKNMTKNNKKTGLLPAFFQLLASNALVIISD